MRILGAHAALAAATILAAASAHAEQLNVVGNERVEASAVELAFGQPSKGGRYSAAEIEDGVKQLLSSGYFADVRAERGADGVVVRLREQPTIGNIVFNGNDDLNDEALDGVISIAPGVPLTHGAVDRAVTAITKAYAKVGRQDAQVTQRVVTRAGNVADIEFSISEGEKTRVSAITFDGAAAFSQSLLRGVISTKVSTPATAGQDDDIYDVDRAERDAAALTQFYHRNGYVEAVVEGPKVVLDEKAKEIYLAFDIKEGRASKPDESSITSPTRANNRIMWNFPLGPLRAGLAVRGDVNADGRASAFRLPDAPASEFASF
jgi:outer membrane protein insertion porin family